MGSVASAVSNVLDKADNWLEGDAVGNAVSSVADVVTDAAKTVGNAVEDTAQAIGKAGEQVDKVVNETIPGGWMTVGLVAGTVATAGVLGAGSSAAAAGTASGSQAAAAASAATSFAGASTATVSSVAAGVLEGAAMGALKGAAVGGISSVLQGGSVLEGALSGAASGALGGGVGGFNQAVNLNPFVEQAIGSAAKAAASPQGLERSLDKIAFNALAGYGGSQLGISPGVAVPAANLARAAAEGKDVGEALKGTAINYAAGKIGSEIGKQIGNVADELKEAVGFEGYGSGRDESGLATEPRELTTGDKALNFIQNAVETSASEYMKDLAKEQMRPQPPARPVRQPRTGLSARELMEQGYTWDPDRQMWKRPMAAGAQQQKDSSGQTPLTPQQLAEMGYQWDPERGVYVRPKPAAAAADETKPFVDPYAALDVDMDKALQPYQDPLESYQDVFGAPKKPAESSISPYADTFDLGGDDTEYAIDRSMSEYMDPFSADREDTVLGEYVDPLLRPRPKPTTNIMAGGAPLQTGSGGLAVPGFASGGSSKRSVDYTEEFIDPTTEGVFRYIRPGIMRGNVNYNLPGYPFGELYRLGMAEGGSTTMEHKPEFFSEGGLNSLGNTYVSGKGDGTSDSIPAMLANGEFVIPADVVSSLGNGSNDSGAKILDEFLKTIRAHKRKADPKKLPPDSKGPLGYLLEAKKRAKK